MSSQTVAIASPGGFTLDLQAEGNHISHVAVLEQMYAERNLVFDSLGDAKFYDPSPQSGRQGHVRFFR